MKAESPDPGTPLNARLSRAGVCSRRKAVELVRQGRVTVDGRRAVSAAERVSEEARVLLDGREIAPARAVYLALNKPAGYTCTLSDRHAARLVTELLPASLGRLYPAGRLDRDSRGLLILTSDGFFAQRVSHPSFGLEKEYLVRVAPPLSPGRLTVLSRGIREGGETLRARRARVLGEGDGFSDLGVVLLEGRKREIRRMMKALGCRVEDLLRVRVGPFRIGTLPPGRWRHLDPEVVASVLALSPRGAENHRAR